MNGKQERIDDKKPWDLSNWGLNKEDIQQTQNAISQNQNELSTDKNETQNDIGEIDSNDGR